MNIRSRWSKLQCERNRLEATPENRRSVLGNALKFIRFPIMEKGEYSEHVEPSGLLETPVNDGNFINKSRVSTSDKVYCAQRFTDMLKDCATPYPYTELT